MLCEALNRSAEKYPEDMFYERIRVDQCVPLDVLNASLMRDLEHLAPFGFGNPSPILAGKDYPLYQADTVGKDHAHLKCIFGPQGEWEGIAFRKGEELENIISSSTVDVAFGLEWNTFRGTQSIQLMIKDIQPEAVWQEKGQYDAQAEIALGHLEAAAARFPSQGFKIVDWRNKNREEWMKTLATKGTLVSLWDGTGTTPGWLEPNPEAQWGMIIGVPSSWDEVMNIRHQLQEQGKEGLILAQSQIYEPLLKERTGYLSREDLVQMYRVLYDLAIKKNPFSWSVGEILPWHARAGLKIFEELGLVRCLRQTNSTIDLEWIPATKKLDLESALRFRAAKRRWEEVKTFSEEYCALPSSEFKKRLDQDEYESIDVERCE